MQVGGIYDREFEAILGGDGKEEVYSAGRLVLLRKPTEKSKSLVLGFSMIMIIIMMIIKMIIVIIILHNNDNLYLI